MDQDCTLLLRHSLFGTLHGDASTCQGLSPPTFTPPAHLLPFPPNRLLLHLWDCGDCPPALAFTGTPLGRQASGQRRVPGATPTASATPARTPPPHTRTAPPRLPPPPRYCRCMRHARLYALAGRHRKRHPTPQSSSAFQLTAFHFPTASLLACVPMTSLVCLLPGQPLTTWTAGGTWGLCICAWLYNASAFITLLACLLPLGMFVSACSYSGRRL